ncbi:MAG: hypothetical protein VBE63_07690 [Lamprobacter sp.]|uniref:carboxylate--amine ligase n=1 Tax=Lamprobacter sp. TaxID=3100796 RepID=UPI002B258D52|nr:hypothetical protein [Lamprobacter sp.]MEA3639811.1 hypothetical protein [Lamprobacter sp.]
MARTAAPKESLPGVIVLGIDSQIGLSILRDLGRAGVPLFGIGRSTSAVGLHSRYLSKGYVHQNRDEALVALLNRIAEEQGARFVITVSEGDILFLNQQRAALSALKLLIPSLENIKTVIDKAAVYALAEPLGIAIPRQFAVAADGRMPVTPAAPDFPVVLKWADPAEVQPALRAHKLPFKKAEYCHDQAELEAALTRYRPIGQYPMVQAYCPGHGLGQMIYLEQGQPLLCFQHQRLHEWPPEGGYSTLCKSLPPDQHQALMDKSVQLLRAIGWEGSAMVEYRFDPNTQQAALMEVNGRFWGSLPLAYHAEARFPWLLYQRMGLGQTVAPSISAYRPGVRCKFLLPDLKRLLRILFQQGQIQDKTLRFNRVRELFAFIAFFFNPRHRYYVMSLVDPGPWVADAGVLIRRGLRISTSKKRKTKKRR